MLVDLLPPDLVQPELDLFATAGKCLPSAAAGALMGALDALNQRFGRGAVSVASAVQTAAQPGHASRQQRRSPRDTTQLDEIVAVRAWGRSPKGCQTAAAA